MRYVCITVLAVFLTGCSTMGMTPEQIAAADASKCEGYGFTRGTDTYAQCMMQIDQARENEDFQQGQAFRASLQDNDVCTSNTYAGTTTTRCY